MLISRKAFNSDTEKLAMDASSTFETLLLNLRNSNLNFKLELSPFSAVISLKKSFIKDKFGTPLLSAPLSPPSAPPPGNSQLLQENKYLNQKLFDQQKAIDALTFDLTNAVNECQEVHKVNDKLKVENKDLKSNILGIKEETDLILEKATRAKHEKLAQEIITKTDELKLEVERNRNYKTEIRNSTSKMEDLVKENKNLQTDVKEIETKARNLSLSLKEAKKDLKEASKNHEDEKCSHIKEIQKLREIKEKYFTEIRQQEKNQRKEKKKEKQSLRKTAQLEVQKFENARNYSKLNDTILPDLTLQTPICQRCPHMSQCILRDPHPPPFGPRSLRQTELDNEIAKVEAIQTFNDHVLNFVKQEEGETLDHTIAKLEALKNLLEPHPNEESEFDNLIQMVKTAQETIASQFGFGENFEYDEDYFDDLINDDLPRYYWGGEDGNEIIFEDD